METGGELEPGKASGPSSESGDVKMTTDAASTLKTKHAKTDDTTKTIPMALDSGKTKEEKKQTKSPLTKTEHSTKKGWSPLAMPKPPDTIKPPAVTKASITEPKLSVAGWENPVVTVLPRNFPLEPTKVEVQLGDSSLLEVVSRLSNSFKQSFKVMSIQAKYIDKPASAALLTSENVELYLALWESPDDKVLIVEVQTRQGDSVIASQYAQHILSVASGSFDSTVFSTDQDSIRYLRAAHTMFQSESSRMAHDRDVDEESATSIKIVYDLLMNKGGDTRMLGAEGICVLVDARETVLTAAICASRAVLLGSNQSDAEQGIHEFVLGVLLKHSVGDNDNDDEGRHPMGRVYKSYFANGDQNQEITSFIYLALVALVHALEIAITFDLNATANPTLLESPSAAPMAAFLANSKQQETDRDVVEELLRIVQDAHLRPHHAWLAAKCLRYLCLASPEAKEATKKNIGMIADAFDEGREYHAKLEAECRLLRDIT